MTVIKKTHYVETLNREVTLYIKLPEDYYHSEKSYPIIYLQDGQNLFFDEDAYNNQSWKLLDIVESNDALQETILVGISSPLSDKRLDEYSPVSFELKNYEPYGGMGDIYIDYIYFTLNPYITKTYRTIPRQTIMLGSSMGGVISLYAAIKYPDTFNKVASLSGAFFVAPTKLTTLFKEAHYKNDIKIYMDCGDNETFNASKETYLKTNNKIYNTILTQAPKGAIIYKVIPGGEHSEYDWSNRLPSIVKYLLNTVE